jgi:hypothetical protein
VTVRLGPAFMETLSELELARECCEAFGLDPRRDAERVLEIASDPALTTEPCCDSGCDPCVVTLQMAASLLRRRRAGA